MDRIILPPPAACLTKSHAHNGGTMTNAPIAPAKILSLVDAGEPLSPRAAAILRGVQRMMRIHAFESLAEVPLPNGRRADVLAVSTKGEFSIVEIKSSIADFRSI